jgi:hypothetical protein
MFSGKRKKIVGGLTGCVVLASVIVAVSSGASDDNEADVIIQTLGTRADLVTDGDA